MTDSGFLILSPCLDWGIHDTTMRFELEGQGTLLLWVVVVTMPGSWTEIHGRNRLARTWRHWSNTENTAVVRSIAAVSANLFYRARVAAQEQDMYAAASPSFSEAVATKRDILVPALDEWESW